MRLRYQPDCLPPPELSCQIRMYSRSPRLFVVDNRKFKTLPLANSLNQQHIFFRNII
ncbi:hypothetical protein DPMN_045961 [Dreissena polymorpha]|uniref:Uncharacterized protein n=1 Tax=Dreissena polymorpha TaxID=45954 RepID=A0A9D4D7I3_DREPO|nr:hypothetical protein DPMN_045961 [Dreissena polymorpha]